MLKTKTYFISGQQMTEQHFLSKKKWDVCSIKMHNSIHTTVKKMESKEKITGLRHLQHTNNILNAKTWILYFSNGQTDTIVMQNLTMKRGMVIQHRWKFQTQIPTMVEYPSQLGGCTGAFSSYIIDNFV